MRLDLAQKAASLLERITELEETIFKLEELRNGKSFELSSNITNHDITNYSVVVEFKEGHLPNEIFKQNILEYAIDNFNVELNELKDELENLE